MAVGELFQQFALHLLSVLAGEFRIPDHAQLDDLAADFLGCLGDEGDEVLLVFVVEFQGSVRPGGSPGLEDGGGDGGSGGGQIFEDVLEFGELAGASVISGNDSNDIMRIIGERFF